MQKPEDQPSGAIRKAIATLNQQQEMTQSRLKTTKALREGLQAELAATQAKYLADIAKMDKEIATMERELKDGEAAIIKLTGLAD